MGFNDKTQQSAPKKRARFTRKKRMIVGLIIMVIMIGIGVGGWLFLSSQKSNDDTIATNEAERIKFVAETAENARQLSSDGKLSEAIVVFDNAIKSTDDDMTKSSLLLNKSTTYINNGNLDEALAFALESKSLHNNMNINQYIARIYVKKGDNQNAIKYYQIAITLVDKSHPLAETYISDYQKIISRLGGAN